MKVIVNKYLNARSEKPSVNSGNPFYRTPGFILEIDDIVIGDEIDGNSIWYHCKDDGCYYWSGGIADVTNRIDSYDVYVAFSEVEKLKFLKSYIQYVHNELQKTKELVGVGVGKKNNELCIIFTVNNSFTIIGSFLNVDKLIFRGIEIPFQLEYSTKFKASTNIFKDYSIPFVLGGSISNQIENNVGTRGVKIYHNGHAYLLTCYHVACYNLLRNGIKEFNQSDCPVIIPSKSSLSAMPPFYYKVTGGQLNYYFDYAIVKIDDKKFTNTINNIGLISRAYTKSDYESLIPGIKVKTYGCISGYKEGSITRLNFGKSRIEHDFIGDVEMIDTIETSQISVGGDSGAPVLDIDNNLIGIVIATNVNSNKSLIMPIHKLFFLKNFTL